MRQAEMDLSATCTSCLRLDRKPESFDVSAERSIATGRVTVMSLSSRQSRGAAGGGAGCPSTGGGAGHGSQLTQTVRVISTFS